MNDYIAGLIGFACGVAAINIYARIWKNKHDQLLEWFDATLLTLAIRHNAFVSELNSIIPGPEAHPELGNKLRDVVQTHRVVSQTLRTMYPNRYIRKEGITN